MQLAPWESKATSMAICCYQTHASLSLKQAGTFGTRSFKAKMSCFDEQALFPNVKCLYKLCGSCFLILRHLTAAALEQRGEAKQSKTTTNYRWYYIDNQLGKRQTELIKSFLLFVGISLSLTLSPVFSIFYINILIFIFFPLS